MPGRARKFCMEYGSLVSLDSIKRTDFKWVTLVLLSRKDYYKILVLCVVYSQTYH